jgi:hypothetical protein
MATMVHQGHGRHTLAYNQERTCASLALVGAEAKKAACEYQNQAAAGAGAFVDHDEIKWRDGVTRNASGGLSVPVVGGNDEDTLMADAGVRDEVAAALHALAQHSACTTHTRIAVSLPALPNPPDTPSWRPDRHTRSGALCSQWWWAHVSDTSSMVQPRYSRVVRGPEGAPCETDRSVSPCARGEPRAIGNLPSDRLATSHPAPHGVNGPTHALNGQCWWDAPRLALQRVHALGWSRDEVLTRSPTCAGRSAIKKCRILLIQSDLLRAASARRLGECVLRCVHRTTRDAQVRRFSSTHCVRMAHACSTNA